MEILTILTDHFLEVFLTLICSGLFLQAKKYFKRTKGLVDSVLAMNHFQLYRTCEFYIYTNQITLNELKNLEYLYNGYHALGGNGTGTELYEKCKDLPVVERRTKFNPYYTGKKEY